MVIPASLPNLVSKSPGIVDTEGQKVIILSSFVQRHSINVISLGEEKTRHAPCNYRK